MLKLSMVSIILTVCTIFLWKLTLIPLEYCFIIFGQGHFILGYYYLYKKNGISFKKLVTYWLLISPILLLLQRDIFSFRELGVLAGYLFLIHVTLDEFSFRSIKFTNTHIISILVFALPWAGLLVNNYYEISPVVLLSGIFSVCVPWSLYIIVKSLIKKENYNLLVLGLITLLFSMSFSLLTQFKAEFIFAVLVLYHVFIWHSRVFLKESFSVKYLILFFITTFPFFLIYINKENIPFLHDFFISLGSYYIWALVHILITFKYYGSVREFIEKKINFPLSKELSLWNNKRFFLIVGAYVWIFIIAVIFHSNLARHATLLAPVGGLDDVFFKFIPYYDTTFFHEHVSNIIKWGGQILLLLIPRFLPFMLLVHSGLIFTRAVFINLTQLPPPEGMLPIDSYNTFGGDLFFSGHVALPFLYALVFWDIKPIRYLFIGISIIFAITTVLGRYHYSIDIFAAPFIAYGVYTICSRIFKKTYEQTKTTEPKL